MDRLRDVPAVYPAPLTEWQMAHGGLQRKVYAIPYCTDTACPSDFLQYAQLHVKRDIPFPDSICILGTECRVGKRCSYAVCLLGICMDESAPGLALEYDHGHAEKSTFEINKSG